MPLEAPKKVCSFCGREGGVKPVELASGRVAMLCTTPSIPCGVDYWVRCYVDRELAKKEAAEQKGVGE